MKKTLIMTLAGFSLAISSLTWAAEPVLTGDPVAGKTKSATCAACHGIDGNSTNPEWPSLAGQSEAYIIKQLHNFKAEQGNADGRFNASMSPMAAPLNEQDMVDLAAYFASQPAKQGEADQTQVALGEQVYKGGNNASGVVACAACHGPNGNGNPAAKFPAIAGQHATYVANQLTAFRKGERHNDAGKMMRNIADKMSDAEIKAVSEYVAGLQR
ncbi:MAG: cytochrome c4 [Thiothrix sp.]|nr:cytochrome c4 [Thiothrix sp.]